MICKSLAIGLSAISGIAALPSPQFGGGSISNSGLSDGGSGPYTANYTTDPSLPGHTIYLPTDVPADLRLPVLIWGEGGCQANGLQFLGLLNEVSSHGVFVIASGEPDGTGQTTAQMLTDAIDWVTSAEAASAYPFLEPGRIAVAGQSCGGVEAYEVSGDERVGVLGIFNSGLMTVQESERIAPTIGKPIFYFLGGSADIAYENGERDYDLLPADTPVWKGNLPVGHSGTYAELDGGQFGVAAVQFLLWTLRGDASAAEFFTGEAAAQAGWEVESKNLGLIDVTPI